MSFRQTGWVTVLDLDFAAQGTQALNTDGAYTIGGLSWTKINSANESSHATVTNGSGLIWTPGNTSDYNGATRSLPAIGTLIKNFYAELDNDTIMRVWVYNPTNAPIGNFDACSVAIDSGNTGFAATMHRGIGPSGAGWHYGIDINSGSIAFGNTALALAASNNVFVMEPGCDAMGVATVIRGFYGQWPGTGKWPAMSTMKPMATYTATFTGNVIDCTRIDPTNMTLLLGAKRAGGAGGGAYSTTVARIKFEVLR